MHRIVVIFVFFSVLACNKPPQSNNEFVLISLRKTACYGKCPVYTLKVYDNGLTTLLVEENMDLSPGSYSAILNKDRLAELRQAFTSANFFDYEKEYNEPVSDLPTAFLYFNDGTNEMEVKDYAGAPESLKNLEQTVEVLITELKWEKADKQ